MTKRSRSLFDGSDENILFCDEDILHDKENNSSLSSTFIERGQQQSGNLVINTSTITTVKKNRFNSNTPISPIEPLPQPSPPLSTRKQFEATQETKIEFSLVTNPTPTTPDNTKSSFQLFRQQLSPNTPTLTRRTNSRTCKTLVFEDNGNTMDTSTCSTSSTSSGSLSGESYICSSISPPTPDTPPSPKYQFLSPLSPLSPLHTFRGHAGITSPPTQNASPGTKRALKGFAPCMSPYEKSLRIQSMRLSHSLQIDDSNVRVPPPIQTQGLSKASASRSIGSGGASPTIITMSPVDLGEMSPGVFCDPTPFDTPGSEEFSLILPTIQAAKVPDCNSITPETLTRVLQGEFNDRADVVIIDCRFPFEYEGGHIRGAVNIFEPESLERLVFDEKRIEGLSKKETMIIFHCEFSQHRAPKLYRHLRELDRKYHHDSYPNLYYTNIYLVEGGYRGFYSTSDDTKCHCEPKAYVEMNDKSFAQRCKESWAAMRKSWSKKKRSAKAQLSMSYLARQR